MFVVSMNVLNTVEARSDEPGVTVDVTGFQWQWTFDYPDSGLSFTGAGEEGPEMVLPVDEPVRIRLHATDVIHSFYVPAVLHKKDVVPGRTNEFEVTVENRARTAANAPSSAGCPTPTCTSRSAP